MIELVLRDDILDKIKSIRAKILPELKPLFDSNFSVLFLNSEISFNYFALGLREILNKTIHKLSNETEIRTSDWFPEYSTHADDASKISTKQRLLNMTIHKHSINAIFKLFPLDERIDDLSKIIKKFNDFVHLKTFVSNESINFELEKVISITGDFFQIMEEINNEIERLLNLIETDIHQYVYGESIQELDEIATHYYEPDVSIESILLQELREDHLGNFTIEITCNGHISAKTQYGSDADQRRDQGVISSVSFPFESVINLDYHIYEEVPSIEKVEIETFDVDNSSWFQE